jgi:hypothetical protein
MNTALKEAADTLARLEQDFAAGRVSSLEHSRIRQDALGKALVAMAEDHGVTLQSPLYLDSNGEFSITALHPNGGSPLQGCGPFGEEFAAALTRHKARTGTNPGILCADNGWCRLNHFEAEKMVRAYAAQKAAQEADSQAAQA